MIFLILCIIALLSFVIAFAKGVHNAGNVSGSIFSVCYIAYFFVREKLPDIIYLDYFLYFVRLLVVICLMYVIEESIVMIKYIFFNKLPKNQTEDKKSVIIVLGCRVKGTKPTKMLMQRIKRANKEYLNSKDAYIIASGGKGSDEIISEALCIKSELVKMNIPESRVFLEDKSKNTYENILFSKKIIKDNLGKLKDLNIIIVSNEFHLYRAYHIAQVFGINAYTSPASTSFYLLLTFWIRELLAILKNIIFSKKQSGDA